MQKKLFFFYFQKQKAAPFRPTHTGLFVCRANLYVNFSMLFFHFTFLFLYFYLVRMAGILRVFCAVLLFLLMRIGKPERKPAPSCYPRSKSRSVLWVLFSMKFLLNTADKRLPQKKETGRPARRQLFNFRLELE